MASLFRLPFRNARNQSANSNVTEITIEDDKTPTWPYIVNSLFYLSVILFIGVPMWFYTCSATRYSLPNLANLEEKLIKSPPKLHLDISVIQLALFDATKTDEDSSFNRPNDKQTEYLRSHLPKNLDTSVENVTYNINWRVRRPTHKENNIFMLHRDAHAATTNENLPTSILDLEKDLTKIHRSSNKFRLFLYLIDEPYYSIYCDSKRVHTYTISFERFVYLCPSNALQTGSDYSHLVTLIESVLEEIYSKTVDLKRTKHTLSAQLDLLISIVPEVSDSSNLLDYLSSIRDKFHAIYEKNVKQIFPELLELVNIRVLSHYMIELLDEEPLSDLIEKPAKKDSQENMTTIYKPKSFRVDNIAKLFQNFEARLDLLSSKSVHDLLVLAPNDTHIFFNTKTSKNNLPLLEVHESKSMLIANDDKTMVLGLRALIRRIVGLENPNLCNSCIIRRDVFFNRWEMDAIMGVLTIVKLQNTLISLQSISQQNVGVKIPKEVSKTANEAYQTALLSLEQLDIKMIHESYRLASKAYDLSESAFYDPSLLESLYFPDDLKYGIYIPFFLPLVLPLARSLVGLLKHLYDSLQTSRGSKLKIN